MQYLRKRILTEHSMTTFVKVLHRQNSYMNILSLQLWRLESYVLADVTVRQGKNLELTKNKRSIHVTGNGDSQSEQ
jgi:hypothetical protein